MSRKLFHTSIEGAQHGPKGLEGFFEFAINAGADGVQPSNYMLLEPTGDFRNADEVMNLLNVAGLSLDGVSCHCITWVLGTAWTGSRTVRPFIPSHLHNESPEKIEEWCRNTLFALFDLCAELEVKVLPMFWGVSFGWEVATGYPWGLWSGPEYDLLKEGLERFIAQTKTIRKRANELGIKLAHEIHPGTAAMCADDFLTLVAACDNDPCLAVNADPSHCWEGEDLETRFTKVGHLVYGCHVKNHTVRPGLPLRSMEPNWQKRGMQFTDLPTGDLNLTRFVELMIRIGYPQRYCELMGTDTAPLVTEAESAYRDLDATAQGAILFTNDALCFPVASDSFEKGMGAAD